MADVEETTYSTEIAILQSMFGNTVSVDVIASVIESVDGDINEAADAIISFANEPSAFQSGTPTTMNLENDPTSSQSNVEPFTNFANQTLSQSEVAAVENRDDNTLIPEQGVLEAAEQQQQQPVTGNATSQEVQALAVSLSEAFRNTGAIPRITSESRYTKQRQDYKINVWPDQITKILTYHDKGTRTLILMRGAAGCGKTYLAKHIVDYTVGASTDNYARHICSTDSYFMRGGFYLYKKDSLSEAHMINQKKVCDAANKGLSPIIVDNTNTEIWEMEPYVRDGVRNGYIIEIVEPNTSWARNANQLSKRNIHNVPRENIIRMLNRYENVTSVGLLKKLKLIYPTNKKPPIKRNIPPFSSPESPQMFSQKTPLKIVKYENNQTCSTSSDSNVNISHIKSPSSPNEDLQNNEINTTESEKIKETSDNDDELLNPEDELKLQKILEAQKHIETFEKVEKEWDNGESWDTAERNTNTISQDQATALEPKPPRFSYKAEGLIEPANICDDWSKISMFMPPWLDDKASKSALIVDTPNMVETKDGSTCVEYGDVDNINFKTIHAQPRIITEGFPETLNQFKRLKIMIDKSTSTHDYDMLLEVPECEHKELHFKAFRRMFKIAPRQELREIFDSCKSDVNWAVNLILDDYPEWFTKTDKNDEESDSDEELIEECQCLAAYNIIPDATPTALSSPVLEKISQGSTPVTQKKQKREIKMSENLLQLKRLIENNVMISDNHYSQHYLNLRRRREENTNQKDKTGVLPVPDAEPEDIAQTTAEFDIATALPETYSLCNDIRDIVRPYQSHYNFQFMDPNESDTESDSNKSDSVDQLVSVNLGTEFLNKIDELFGRQGFQYPENIQPTVSLPMSLLRQINAHWAMSVASQMDDGSKQTEEMIKQDEDIARHIAAREIEMSIQGQEPDVPTLKEIMDMEFAYSIYERDVAEWRNDEPNDMAARLSREKLYNLFPSLSKDVLSEILMAHDYNFKATVESLLTSTGQANWLEDEKGIEKFVMNKEMERKTNFLEEENKNLSEVEWPFLSNPEKPITLDTVNFYRAEAQKYLEFRNANFEKARQYFSRNSPYAASFYSEIAALHTKKYEQSSCLAAAYLMNYHLMNNPDRDVLDLHFLRVPEAMVNLDLFLDQIILRIRTKNMRCKDIWIITGKGAHSPGGPRIKPAAKRRLKARNIPNKLVNGGLLMAQLFPEHKMTSELGDS